MKKFIILLFSITPLFLNAQTITSIAGSGYFGNDLGDGGQATNAVFYVPYAIAADTAGNLYITSTSGNKVRKISTSGIVNKIAGTGTYGFGGDGGLATAAMLRCPSGLAVSTSNNIFIGDDCNYKIRRVNASGIIQTFAGLDMPSYAGDHGPATNAYITGAAGIYVDNAGNVYFADWDAFVIRKINTAGIITTVVGTGVFGYTGDHGSALAAELNEVRDVTFDHLGNMYIAETGSNVIRKVNTSGIITTVAGNGYMAGTSYGGYAGDTGPATAARLNHPYSVRVDGAGNMFIADFNNNVIRRVDYNGIITTYAGNGTTLFGGDGGLATNASLYMPSGLYIDKNGCLLIADGGHGNIRKVTPSLKITSSAGDSACIGSMVTFHAKLSCWQPTMKYKWHINSTLCGVDSTNYSTNILNTGDKIWCNVYNSTTGDTIVTSDTIIMQIYAPPSAGIILGDSVVCPSTSLSLIDTVAGGTWSASNTNVVISALGIVTGMSIGSSVVYYSFSNIHCTYSKSKIITILPLPDVGIITGDSMVCQGATLTLNNAVVGGTWSASNSIVSISGTGVVTGISVGTVDILYSTTNGYCNDTALKNITINPLPIPGTITGADTIILGLTNSYFNSALGGSWSLSNTINATVSAIGDVTGNNLGFDTLIYTVTNICGDSSTYYPLVISLWHGGVKNVTNSLSNLVLSPNPCSDEINISISAVINENVELGITDITGKLLKQYTVKTNTANNIKFDLQNGTYFLVVNTTDGNKLTRTFTVFR